uniref:PGG domain-containing protein n=1 Tax=Macrostomum lignano TaxID=282301 RepID=A0A1I8FEX6_9PLAT
WAQSASLGGQYLPRDSSGGGVAAALGAAATSPIRVIRQAKVEQAALVHKDHHRHSAAVHLLLIAAVGFFAARSADLESRIETSRSQNLTLFGLFDPNAPPPGRDFHHGNRYKSAWNQPAIWSGKLTISATCYLLVNVSLPYQQCVGLYLRRKTACLRLLRHDFFHRLVNVQSQVS